MVGVYSRTTPSCTITSVPLSIIDQSIIHVVRQNLIGLQKFLGWNTTNNNVRMQS